MVKSILSAVAAAALICSYTSAAGTPDDADSAQTLLRKSTRNLEENAEVDPLAVCEQMMKAQGMEHELQNVLQGNSNGNRSLANTGTITLNAGGGMTISGYHKLTTDIEVPEELGLPGSTGSAAITLLDGAVLDCDGHSITGGGSMTRTDGIKVMGDGAQIHNCAVAAFKNGIFGENGGGTLEMNDVAAVDNEETGIYLVGWDNIELDKIVTNENGGGALHIESNIAGTIQVNDIEARFNGQGEDVAAIRVLPNSRRISIEKARFVGGGQAAVGIYISGVSGGTVEMKDISVTDTLEIGIFVDGGNTVLEDVISDWNIGDGLVYSGESLSLKGENSFSNNGDGDGHGLIIKGATTATTVSVDAKAKVAVNNNDGVGIRVENAVGFTLEKKASLEACDNDVYDWDTAESTSTFDGKKYHCDADKINGDGPECKSCE